MTSLATAILSALFDQAIVRATRPSHPLDKAALSTRIKTFVSEAENEADGLDQARAFLQGLCDELELDMAVRHLAPIIHTILAAVHERPEKEIRSLLGKDELQAILALFTFISVTSISMKNDGSVELGLSLTIGRSDGARDGAHDEHESDEKTFQARIPGASTLHASREAVVNLGQGWSVCL